MRKPEVDPEKCIGCGSCASTEPEVFEMNGSLATVKNIADYEVFAAGIDSAISGCPVAAISWTGEEVEAEEVPEENSSAEADDLVEGPSEDSEEM